MAHLVVHLSVSSFIVKGGPLRDGLFFALVALRLRGNRGGQLFPCSTRGVARGGDESVVDTCIAVILACGVMGLSLGPCCSVWACQGGDSSLISAQSICA